MLFGKGFFNAAMVAALNADAAVLASLLRVSPSFPYRGRSRGDRAHKRWKRARAAGRR